MLIFLSGAQKGITLTFDGKFIRLGLLTLPLDFLCTSTEITKILACQICDKDCKSVHNTYGGQCAVRSDTGETICECQDDPPANCTVSTSEQRCGQLYGRDLPLGKFSRLWKLCVVLVLKCQKMSELHCRRNPIQSTLFIAHAIFSLLIMHVYKLTLVWHVE